MPISKLSIAGPGVRDLTPLKGLPLTYLYMPDGQSDRFGPLAGLKLKYLSIGMTSKVTDFSPLRGMPLTEVSGPFNAAPRRRAATLDHDARKDQW